MRDKIITVAVTIMTVCACAAFASTLVHASLAYQPEEEFKPAQLATSSAMPASSLRSAPVRLIIPSLNVDTKVQDVGIGKSGNMAVPSNYTDAGWYRYGATPGQVGSAVMDGH